MTNGANKTMMIPEIIIERLAITPSKEWRCLARAIHLIEDMFYTEHIYEKLSVYAEYIQTCLQHGHTGNNTISSI